MTEARKLAAILVADVVGYSRLAGADEDRTLARLRELRSDLIDPAIAAHRGRIVKRTGDGSIIEFRSVVDAVRCAIEVQSGLIERNVGVPEDRRIEFRVGIHVGDVVEESDGDLMGDGVNVAARLEGVAKPGAICLSEDAYRQVKSRLDLKVSDLGPTQLKNIAEPIRVYSLEVGQPAQAKSATYPEPSAPERPSARLALPDKPSIGVLPFQNMSGDPDQEYFVDGMVEDIITGLSRIKWLFVIARNSSFVYKGKLVDVRQAGRELGVRYVLEGSVRKAGGRLRITAQLIEAETGAHLWADRFDGALQDIFDLQDQITEKVVGVVEPSLQRSEIDRSRRKHPENLSAYELYLRALPHVMAITAPEAKIAIPFLQDALRLDANYAPAHALMAWCHQTTYLHAGFAEADKLEAIRHARAAIGSDTDDATALALGANATALMGKDYDTALRAIDRALSLNPSSAVAHFFGAQLHSLRGNPGVAIKLGERALRLSPFDRLAFAAHQGLAIAGLQEGRFEDACACFADGVRANSTLASTRFLHALATALAGRPEQAKAILRDVQELEPNIGMRFAKEIGAAPEIVAILAQGARILGLPEQ